MATARVAAALVASAILSAAPAHAQNAEVVPFVGYRFGGDFYELVTRERVDEDGGVAFGLALDIPFRDDLQIEGFFTHQSVLLDLPADLDVSRTGLRVDVDHWQIGGLRELRPGRARPFLTGTVGLTRYGAEGDNELRFSLSAGGGVKLYPTRRLGLRLDGRVFATFVDADVDALACRPGLCVGTFDAWVVWQAEFAAGVMIGF